ncbi:MAG: SET domain-containing protein [Patescibacteria group bacterium]
MYLIKIEVGDSKIEGKGVFTLEDIKKDSVVWRYDPNHDESLSITDFEALDKDAREGLLRVAYLSESSNRWVYPPDDDPARFTNHSEQNNLSVIFDKSVSEEPLFVANKDIKKDEELTVNYLEFDNRPEKDVLDWAK